MHTKTKIMVIKMRDLIYTAVLLILIALLLLFLFLMFHPVSKNKSLSSSDAETSTLESETKTSAYIAGIYTTPITLGNSSVDVEVTVDQDHINAIRLVNLSETATAMYPLISPSLEDLAFQICTSQSLENITCPESNKYTSQLLLNAVAKALNNAAAKTWN